MQVFRYLLIVGLLLVFLLPAQATIAAERFKVLVVSSYEEDYLWTAEIRAGIEQTLGGTAELKFYYMNTKDELSRGTERAAEAYQLYLKFQPDGVIAADDNAQSMFVVPYLRNKVKTPVMFCGVNGDPEHYGYPALNVSGILERYHFEETLAFNRQFDEQIKRFVYMGKAGPTADMEELQLNKLITAEKLSVKLVGFLRPETRQQALELAREYREKADLLIVGSLQGVTDEAGKALNEIDVLPEVFRAFNKPSGAINAYTVRYGALAAVVKSGMEQGKVAARMLLQAMRGTPLTDLPITRNYFGTRMINVTTLRQLQLKPPATALRGAELVRSV